jgi:hypothetical protein
MELEGLGAIQWEVTTWLLKRAIKNILATRWTLKRQ